MSPALVGIGDAADSSVTEYCFTSKSCQDRMIQIGKALRDSPRHIVPMPSFPIGTLLRL